MTSPCSPLYQGVTWRYPALLCISGRYVTLPCPIPPVSGSYVASFREMRSVSSIHHPVEAFLMLRRLTVDWDIVEDDLRRQVNQTQGTLYLTVDWDIVEDDLRRQVNQTQGKYVIYVYHTPQSVGI